MKRLAAGVIGALLAITVLISAPRNADARLQYFKEFESLYGAKVPAIAMKKCGSCHGGVNGANKKILIKYGEELKKQLGEKNVKDVDKIKKAFQDSEKGDADDGKTFGDYLNNGEIPP